MIPLRIVATDIDTGKKIIFKTGNITDALRASIGIPGVFEPFEIMNHRLVDGGLTENIPCSTLSSENIIAVSALRDISRNTRKRTKILGFEFENHLASSYTIMQKSIDILLFQNEEKSIRSSSKRIILIRPRFPEIDYYEFGRYEEIIQIGYEEAKKILRETSENWCDLLLETPKK
jgi:NTE family protein